MVDETGLNIKMADIRAEIPLVIGEKEYEMIELLRKTNLSRPIAFTLACLVKGGEVSSQSIEMVSGLRQPEVSVAMRYLRKNNWIDVREEKKSKGKGRPIKLYKLTVPIGSIVNKIEQQILQENQLVLQNIQYLKRIS